MKVLQWAFCVLLVAATLVGAGPVVANPPATHEPVLMSTTAQRAAPALVYSRAAVRATNRQRVRRDRARVRVNNCLQRFANKQARRMARQERMFHQDLGPLMRACKLRLAGENVAYGYPNGASAVNSGWMRSAPHRSNLLDRRHRLLAVAAVQGKNGAWYACQILGRR